jgi:hypothetical protein
MIVTKKQDMQRIIRHYKDETGEHEVDMHKVALYAYKMGWPMPKPKDPLDLLATSFSQAAREEIRHDKKTGRPYRANHALSVKQGDAQISLWIDIDEAPRKSMQKSLVNRREQMVGDGLQLTLDADHWNSINSSEDPIVMPMDFSDDIEWRKNAPNDEDAAA